MVIERALEKLKQAQAANPPVAAKAERPQIHRTAEAYVADRQARSAAVETPILPRPVYPELSCDVELAVQNRILLPGTPLALDGGITAAYRMIRARLQNLISTSSWRTLAITSPEPGEGKSVTALNLALSFSRDESKSLFLIDLDMRNPAVCKYLGVRPAHSVVEYFAGTCQPQNIFFSIGTPNLAIAGNNAPTDMASELLAGDRLEQLFDYIRSVAPNAFIIIDLPPILVTDEALMMAPRVDATALVVADGQTRRDSLLRARQLLAEFSFAGVILNKSSESLGKAGYYYGYGPREK
jgi:capsular exopolysaccharide synthesis family protein